jgi:hypothetical protein
MQMWLKFHCFAYLLSTNDLMAFTKVLRQPLSLGHVHTSIIKYFVELFIYHYSFATLYWPYNYSCILQVVFGLPASAQHEWKGMQMVKLLLLGLLSFLEMKYFKFLQLNWLWWHHQLWPPLEPSQDYEGEVFGCNS